MHPFRDLAALFRLAVDELEHLCDATRELITTAKAIANDLQLIRLRLERVDGRLDRLEQAIQLPREES